MKDIKINEAPTESYVAVLHLLQQKQLNSCLLMREDDKKASGQPEYRSKQYCSWTLKTCMPGWDPKST